MNASVFVLMLGLISTGAVDASVNASRVVLPQESGRTLDVHLGALDAGRGPALVE